MPAQMSIPNIITLTRLPLLLVVIALLYLREPWAPWAALFLLPVLYLMDWFDGYLARQIDQVTQLGSVLDIAIDRVVENALWIVFAHLQMVPVWIPLVFIIRSFVIDGMRGFALAKGHSAFGMMHSSLGRWLVAGRFMRGLYGGAKAGAFCALTLVICLSALEHQPPGLLDLFNLIASGLVYLSVGLCVVRGVPVLFDIQALLEEEGPA